MRSRLTCRDCSTLPASPGELAGDRLNGAGLARRTGRGTRCVTDPGLAREAATRAVLAWQCIGPELHRHQLSCPQRLVRDAFEPEPTEPAQRTRVAPVRVQGDPLVAGSLAAPRQRRRHRSEEHTSELQSLMRISYAV